MLNTFFGDCFNHCVSPLDFKNWTPFPVALMIYFVQLKWLLKHLDTSKSNGPDGISARMLKLTAPSIAPSITNLFNVSVAFQPFGRHQTLSRYQSQIMTMSLLIIVLSHFFLFLASSHMTGSSTWKQGRMYVQYFSILKKHLTLYTIEVFLTS